MGHTKPACERKRKCQPCLTDIRFMTVFKASRTSQELAHPPSGPSGKHARALIPALRLSGLWSSTSERPLFASPGLRWAKTTPGRVSTESPAWRIPGRTSKANTARSRLRRLPQMFVNTAGVYGLSIRVSNHFVPDESGDGFVFFFSPPSLNIQTQ